MAARTLNSAVLNDPPGAPGAISVVYKPSYSGNGGSAWAELLSRRTHGIKMEDKTETTIKTQSTKTSATATKIRPKPHIVDLEADSNPFARRGSVSRSPPMLTRSDSKASECSVASLAAEGKIPKPKLAKPQALIQDKRASDLDSANVDGVDATAFVHDEVTEVLEPVSSSRECLIGLLVLLNYGRERRHY